MAFKFVVLFSILVAVNAGDYSGYDVHYAPTVEKTIQYAAPVTKTIYPSSPVYASKAVYEHEPIQYDNYHAKTIAYPSHGHYGHETVSHHGKIIATPHSYVKKYDTRIISEEPHYKYAVPAVQTVVKTPVAYPTIVKSPIVPVVKSHYEPEYHHHSYAQAAPIIKSHYEPEYHHHSYAQAAPIIKSHYEPEYHHHSYAHAAPIVKSHYEPEYHHHSYAHAAPVIKTAAVSYSPATAVSHASFQSSNAHYGW
uniref:Putative cuticular protein n=1 Tax=Mayetiola destructor TaxID=39758 RepID=F6KPQ9_MAYDE|nr:putative cuticular protein [Mayetiola destructor]